jgi:hypothetical protein
MSKEVLDHCLNITGVYENGKPNYQGVSDNFDGQGISVGILQWCAGQGSLGHLLSETLNCGMSSGDMDGYFNGTAVSSIPSMEPRAALQFVHQNFLDDNGIHLVDGAKEQWVNLLTQDAAVNAQVNLAVSTVLASALHLVATYCPENNGNLRATAFFFDTVTQCGGMHNARGMVSPVAATDADPAKALAYAQAHPRFHQMLQNAIQSDSANEDLMNQLLYYAYERAMLGKPDYQWDTFSRRATIATRHGIVHGAVIDFSTVLP